jgi:hypothetical protein
MRQDKPNQHGLILVVDFGNKPELIPADVEDRAFLIWVSVREHLPCFREALPCGSLGHAIPRIERFFGLRVLLPELSQSLSTDDMQGEPLSRTFLI